MGKRLLLAMLIFTLGLTMLKSQEKYAVRGTVYVSDGKASKVSLSLFSHPKETKIPVDINGDFVVQLNWNTNYQFYFSKPGYVGKRINFSTQIPNGINKKSIYPYELLVELFPTFPNADTTFFKNPVAKIRFSGIKNDFDYDLDYFLIVKDKINTLKNQYASWRKQTQVKQVSTNKAITKEQHASALRYQKSVENKEAKVVRPVKPKVTRVVDVPVVEEDNYFGLPPFKNTYSEGKHIEVFELKGKVITRVIIKNGVYQKIFYQVKHNWGGLYYFVKESPSNYRSISKYNFEKATKT